MCPTPRLAGDSQVEIEVLATGLNFKDVLFTTGLLRQQPGEAPLQLGLECAGRITRVGKNVTGAREDVMAVLNGGFVQYARVESDCVVRNQPIVASNRRLRCLSHTSPPITHWWCALI